MTVQVHPAESGGWLAFAAGPRVLVVAPSTEDGFVAAAWAAISRPDGFQAVLDLLASRGLSAMSPFALVEWSEGTARVIVRGEAAVEIEDAAATATLTGEGISTWLERSLPGVTAFSVSVPGAEAAGTVALPLESGVALAARVGSGAVAAKAGESLREPQQTAPLREPQRAAAPEPVAAPAEPDPGETVREAPAESRAQATAEAAASSAPESGEGYDYLFGDTMYRSVADAAVHEPESAGEPAAADSTLTGDHDGHTVLTSDIAKLRTSRKRSPTAPPPAVPPAAKLVLVVSSTGAREPLSQSILVGRAPSVSKVSGGSVPRLLTIGADQDISRNHAQIALEGGTVVVTDLHSKNGTSIVLPGKSPQKLRAGEPTSVIVGTVIDLGGGLTLTVDED